MSQSSAILTLHRRTGGDTEGGRAIAATETTGAGCVESLLRRKPRGDSPRVPPGPASKLPSLGRRGLAETLRAPRGAAGGACCF